MNAHALAALGLLATAACGVDPPAQPPADGTLTLTGYIQLFIDVPDLQIGVFDVDGIEPVHPDDRGAFRLDGLPADRRFTLEANGTGLVATLVPVPASSEDIHGFRVLAPREGTDTYPDGIDPQTADVMVLVQRNAYLGTGLALAEVTMTPPATEAVDYRNDAGATDLSGRAFFRRAPAGIVEVGVASDRPCVALAGWEGSSPDSTLVPAALGHFTLVPIVCRDPEGTRIVQGEVSTALDDVALAGASICVSAGACATSNAAGVYQMSIEDGEGRTVTVSADGHLDTLRALGDSYKAGGTLSFEAWTSTELDELVAAAGMTAAADASYVMFSANASEWHASFSPSAQLGPVYFDPSGTPDSQRQDASINGGAFAAGVSTPTATIDVTHPALSCTSSTAWLGSERPFDVPTAPASVTVVSFGCYPP